MPFSIDDPQVMREIIMDHYSNPIHKSKPIDDNYVSIRMDSDSCIDDITIFLLINDEKITDALFDGIACTISTASTDILCDLIIGKTKSEALYIIDQYQKMIFEKEYDMDVLKELLAFKNTYKQAARVKCATLGSNGIKELLGEKDEKR